MVDMFPKKYWCAILVSKALKTKRLAIRGDGSALLVLSRNGWLPRKGIPEDLWPLYYVFRCVLTYVLKCCVAGVWQIQHFFSCV